MRAVLCKMDTTTSRSGKADNNFNTNIIPDEKKKIKRKRDKVIENKNCQSYFKIKF